MIHMMKDIIRKNQAEAKALLIGRMPDFVYGIKRFKDIPVFCFHSAQYPLFEKQLQFINDNGYTTLTADELYERRIDKNYKNTGKEVVITFDDGMASVWAVAFPLLNKYEHKIISFILPGLIPEGEGVGVTIDDVASEQEKTDLSNRDYSNQPLCNWNEIKLMHDSGLVDFQSHGMNHALISTSSKIIDFIHPGYDAYHYGNIHIPMYRDAEDSDTRKKVLGHPVYQHSPRLSGKARYFDPIEIRQVCAAYVEERGGREFFLQPDWRHKLKKLTTDLQTESSEHSGNYETPEQMRAAILDELAISKSIIEDKLNKDVTHFCFPWFIGSAISADMSYNVGYLAAHMGATNGFIQNINMKYPLFINRLQEEYFQVLPGTDSRSLLYTLLGKIRKH